MKINGQQVTFNVLDVMKSLDNVEDCNFVSTEDFAITERLKNQCSKGEIKVATFEKLKVEHHGLETTNMAQIEEKKNLS